MRLPLALSLLALVGCAKTITVPRTLQQYAIASSDNCAQGPFTIGVYTPNEKQQNTLRLSFTEDATPAKLFYQVKSSGVAIASGTLEQKIEPKAGGFIPKNQCLGRIMPKMAGDGTEGNGGEGQGEVIQPGYQAPQYQWVTFAKVPGSSPSVEIELKGITPNSYVEVLYWSEVPYPLHQARMQVELITLTKEKVKDEAREAKKVARAIEIALVREQERFEAAQSKDAYLASLQEQEPERRDLYKFQRGKLLHRFSKQWSKSIYEERYSPEARAAVHALLGAKVNVFLQERQGLIYFYEDRKDDQLDQLRDERHERRKRAVERYVAIETRHIKRVMKRDKKLEEEQKGAKQESKIKDIRLKRGKKLSHYDKHYERFDKLTDIRVFDRGRPEKYYQFQAKASNFLSKNYDLISGYESWKENKRQNKKEDRAKEKQENKLKKSIKMLETWKDRFDSLKQKDKEREAQLQGKTKDEQLMIQARRGLDMIEFRKRFEKDFYRFYYEQSDTKNKSLWAALQEEINIFSLSRQEQIDAHYQLQNKKLNDRYAKKDRNKKDKYEKKQEVGLKRTKREAKHFAKVKKKDADFVKKVEGSSGKKQDKISYQWGRFIKKYSKHFQQKYDEICCSDLSTYPKDGSLQKLQQEVNALVSLRYSVINKYWSEKNSDKRKIKNLFDKSERQFATNHALRQWERALKQDKRALNKIESASAEDKIERVQRRQKKMRKAIGDLLDAYYNANSYGRNKLAKAYNEALALQQNLNTIIVDGPTPPPLPAYENPGQKPMDGAIWHPGYWKQESGQWVWKKGYWELPPGAI